MAGPDLAAVSAIGTKRTIRGRQSVFRFALFSDVNLLGNCQGVVYFDAEVPDCAFDLGMPEQQLDGPEIARATIDQCRFSASRQVPKSQRPIPMSA